MSKTINSILIAAFVIAIVLAIQPVTSAFANLINNRAINEGVAASIASRLNAAQVENQITALEQRRQFIPLTVQLEFFAIVILVAILAVPATLIYAAFVRKLFLTVANPRNPWITIQTQLPPGAAESRPFLAGSKSDRLFYQSVSRLYTQVTDNPNLPAGEKQVILAYLAALLRERRSSGHNMAEIDPYSFDYE